jgi:hypothetical protein
MKISISKINYATSKLPIISFSIKLSNLEATSSPENLDSSSALATISASDQQVLTAPAYTWRLLLHLDRI